MDFQRRMGKEPLGLRTRKQDGGCISRSCALVALLFLLWMAMLGTSALAQQPKNINVAVRAKWTGTPLLLEAGELVAKESEEAFWDFVRKWVEFGQGSGSETDAECFHRILRHGKSVLGDHLGHLLHLSLLVRSASPKLVLFRQLAQESLLIRTVDKDDRKDVSGGPEIDRWAVSSNPQAPDGECCWVDVGSRLVFGEGDLSDWLKMVKDRSSDHTTSPELFEFDHIFPGSQVADVVAVLYGALGTPCFQRLHALLSKAGEQGLVKYAVRSVLPSGCEASSGACGRVGAGGIVNLGGYGVELALKNMEYTAIDDSDLKKGADATAETREDGTAEEQQADLDGEVDSLRDHLLSSEIADQVNVEELKDLGFQAAQVILGAPEPLQMMQDINQNLPKLVSWLAHVQANETLRAEVVSNQKMVQAGKNLLAINGALISIDTVDLFTLLDLIQGELSLADKIRKLTVPSKYVKRLLQIPEPAEQSTVRVDFRSQEFVHYLNNLEEDAVYRRWSSNLNQLLMPVYPGQLRYVRKNLYHAVYVIDPASASGLGLVETIMIYYQNSVPMRFGLILVAPKVLHKAELQHGDKEHKEVTASIEEDPSSMAIKVFFYLKESLGVSTAFEFLLTLNTIREDYDDDENDYISLPDVQRAFLDLMKQHDRPGQVLWKDLQSGAEYGEVALSSSLHAHRLGLSQIQPCLLMNGLLYDESQVQQAAILAMNEELPRIQEGVYFGTINYRTDVLDKFLSENGHARYNPQILGPASDANKYVSLTEPLAVKQATLARLLYVHSPGTEDDVKPITHWLALDLSSSAGRDLLLEAVRYLSRSPTKSRVAVLHNAEDLNHAAAIPKTISIVFAAINSPTRRAKVVPFLESFLASQALQDFDGGKLDSDALLKDASRIALQVGLKADYIEASLSDAAYLNSAIKQMAEEQALLSTLFGLRPGQDAVITNGRVFVQDKGKYFVADDFPLLDAVQYEKRVKPVQQVVSEIEWSDVEPDDITSEFLSTVIMAVSSSMAARSRSSDSARFDLLRGDHSAIVRQVDVDIHVDAIIDPLSSHGQRLTPILVLLEEWLQPSMRILLNPSSGLSDLPLKNFYRYVVPVKEDGASHGPLTAGPVGHFSTMPPLRTMTMNLDVPEPWLVEPVIAVHDLDNIVLEKLSGRTMLAVFELEALVVTGQCYEKVLEPPRGLQLVLGTKIVPHMVDTIVMANLGYWQLKAAPGVFNLKLAPGKSTELYTLQGPGEGTDAGPVERRLVIQSLRGEVVRLEVVKKKGKENQKMVDADDDLDDESTNEAEERKRGKSKTAGIFKWATNFMGVRRESEVQPHLDKASLVGHQVERHGETINIFSIASGHLYERFLKIMMLSVLKNTRRPVKFWFIKNYLSPQFKDVIPHMAKEYGFEYDLVTYKWPSWLHKQTEKQRLIWAYKILFLDVIFPLSLKKVIFVDADQIVRTDIGELYDMHIGGRPLAYTPFCDNNKDMDGYRFWSQGFWKDHLRGKPYHISALYVVDLMKFRQTAAGDKLRVFYESLSKDPNSLSNLDQDLPNYAQHTVPIFSLPQQWLWCESWCGNATKSQAKTIDLCNNPMTKEPKLDGARRIVAEWPALDEEAREFTARLLHGDDAQPRSVSPVVENIRESSQADRDAETVAEL